MKRLPRLPGGHSKHATPHGRGCRCTYCSSLRAGRRTQAALDALADAEARAERELRESSAEPS